MVLLFSTSKSSSLVSSLSSTPRSWHSHNLRGGRDRVIDGNTTNSPRRRVHSGTGATFSRAAPQRPWQCRLGTRAAGHREV